MMIKYLPHNGLVKTESAGSKSSRNPAVDVLKPPDLFCAAGNESRYNNVSGLSVVSITIVLAESTRV
jgi:hypothetical protein